MWKTIASFAKVIEVFYLFYPFLKTIRPFHHFDIPRFYVNFFFQCVPLNVLHLFIMEMKMGFGVLNICNVSCQYVFDVCTFSVCLDSKGIESCMFILMLSIFYGVWVVLIVLNMNSLSFLKFLLGYGSY